MRADSRIGDSARRVPTDWVVVSGRARVTRGEDDIERFEDRYNRG